MYRHRYRQRSRLVDIHVKLLLRTEIQTYRYTGRQIYSQTVIQADTDTVTHNYRQTHTQTDTDTDEQRGSLIKSTHANCHRMPGVKNDASAGE